MENRSGLSGRRVEGAPPLSNLTKTFFNPPTRTDNYIVMYLAIFKAMQSD